jgi:hypothetical protein
VIAVIRAASLSCWKSTKIRATLGLIREINPGQDQRAATVLPQYDRGCAAQARALRHAGGGGQGRSLSYLLHERARSREAEIPASRSSRCPAELAGSADCGLTVLTGASPQAYLFAVFILSVDGQRMLATHGVAAPALPQ